jgi:hypothetical protein
VESIAAAKKTPIILYQSCLFNRFFLRKLSRNDSLEYGAHKNPNPIFRPVAVPEIENSILDD